MLDGDQLALSTYTPVYSNPGTIKCCLTVVVSGSPSVTLTAIQILLTDYLCSLCRLGPVASDPQREGRLTLANHHLLFWRKTSLLLSVVLVGSRLVVLFSPKGGWNLVIGGKVFSK